MVQRCSNGAAFVVLEPEPSIRTGIRVDVFEGDNPLSLIARLPLTWGRRWTDPLKGTGSAEFFLHAVDETLAANPDLLKYGNICRFSLDEVYRFAMQIEHLERVQVEKGGDVAKAIKVSGRGVLSKLEETVLYPAGGLAGAVERVFTDATPGEILGTAFDEAQARGGLVGITRDFTDTDDSNNAPYDETLTLTERAGITNLRIASRMGELAGDVWMTPTGVLKFANTRGVDRSLQLVNAGPVILQPADNIEQLTRSEDGSVRNTLLIETAAGFLERQEGGSVTEYGRREAYLSLGNTTDGDAATRAGDAVFAQSANPAAQIGIRVLDKEGARPYVDWSIGDWVLAPDENEDLERLRVRSITVSEDNQGQPIFTPELATITEELEARLERWLSAMSKGTVGGTAGSVAEPVKAPVEVVEAIDAGLGDHLLAQPHFDELADLTDVDPTGWTAGDLLYYDGTDWIRVTGTPSLGDVPVSDGGGGVAWNPQSGGGGSGVAEVASDNNALRGSPALSREFTSGETEDSTTVEDTSPNITKTKSAGKLSIYHPGGDASAELHGIVWPYSPAGDFYIEAAFRMQALAGNHSIMGLVAADGNTYGAGTQMFFGINGSNRTMDIRNFANWNSQAAGAAQNLTAVGLFGLLYVRLAYNSGTDLWTGYWSPDGISWITGQTQTDANPATTHVGFAHSSWGGAIEHVAAWEYIAAYATLP